MNIDQLEKYHNNNNCYVNMKCHNWTSNNKALDIFNKIFFVIVQKLHLIVKVIAETFQ